MNGQIRVDVAEMNAVKAKVDQNISEMESFHQKITAEMNRMEGENIYKSTQGSRAIMDYYESLRTEAQKHIQTLTSFNTKLANAAAKYSASESERAGIIGKASESVAQAAAPLKRS
ncbi:MAG: hypothetical protein HFG48_01520 [Bacilli bacterium]|nr:hypothetical protein [Bacilli bacterium]